MCSVGGTAQQSAAQIRTRKVLPSRLLSICTSHLYKVRSNLKERLLNFVPSRTRKCGCLCSWDVRLAALKGYYGQPKSTIFPFAYLNPGGYISNVTFWLNALKDYELGKVSYGACLGQSHGGFSAVQSVGCC